MQQRLLLCISDLNNIRSLDGGETQAASNGDAYQKALAVIETAPEPSAPLPLDSLSAVLTLRRDMAFGTGSPVHRALAFNRILVAHGLCPLVHFAFGYWSDIDERHSEMAQRQTLQDLIELSVHYLYRVISKPVPSLGREIGRGAYSVVYLTGNAEVLKVPANLAAMQFAMSEEAAAARIAASSQLAPYIPRIHGFEIDNQRLRRAYIAGPSGHDLLRASDGVDVLPGKDQLCVIYAAANALWHSEGLNLDIHPGNFLWDGEAGQWYLIDLGPMPRLGAEYVPRDGFDSYFDKIWSKRLELMRTVPIRSIDLEPETLALAHHLIKDLD